jgi:hypothetical protein
MENFELQHWQGSAAQWAALLEGVAGPGPVPALQADFGWGQIAAGGGRGLRRIVLRHDGRAVAAAQIVGRGPLWLISRGPVFAPDLPDETRRALLRALARQVPGLLLATPEAPLAGFGLVPLVTARHHAFWSLRPSPEALRAGLEAKWRNRLAAAERAGLVIERRDDPGVVLAREAAQQRARGYRALPPEFVLAWEMAHPGAVMCLVARPPDGGAPLAGVVVLAHGAGAIYHAGWTGEEGRRLGAHNLLLWQAALRLRMAGVRQFDLGDVETATPGGAGRAHFKRGTGAEARPLGATLWVLPGAPIGHAA